MFILGVNISHHPSVALLKDGELIFYLEDDRLNRNKEKEWAIGDRMQCFSNVAGYTKHVDHIIFTSFVKDRFYDVTDYDLIGRCRSQLKNFGITYDKLHFQEEHHLYHATNAFYSTEFEEAGALILDGGGALTTDWIRCREYESMYYFSGTDYEVVQKVYGQPDPVCNGIPNSIRVDDKTIISNTLSCGWTFAVISWAAQVDGEAGKAMGLAPYGDAEKAGTEPWFKFDEEVGIWITDNKNILNTIRRCCNDNSLDPLQGKRVDGREWGRRGGMHKHKEFIFGSGANMCKKGQEETEKHTIRLIQELIDKTGTNNVLLSGGYALNCVNNYSYIKAFPEVNFFIDPCAHDGGTSIGAARYLWHNVLKNEQRYPLKSLFLGG